MNLQVYSPLEKVLQTDIQKVVFETLNGYQTLLPKHVDYVAALNTGIISYVTTDGEEGYLACHEGVVVKKAQQVTISAQGVLWADTLDELQENIAVSYKENEEQRKELNLAMARLELGLMRGFQRLQRNDNGTN